MEKIAPALGLSSSALINLPAYRPEITLPSGLECFVSAFGHAGVNAFVITRNNMAVIIDTGTDASAMLAFLDKNSLSCDTLLVTHRHGDHVACIDAFDGCHIIYPEEVNHGDTIQTACGPITALDVSGHIIPARAYLYEELETPVCAVGDSIFAGSMGGTKHPDHYPIALNTAREHIMTLDDNTIILPGHGPITSVGLETKNNPFLYES